MPALASSIARALLGGVSGSSVAPQMPSSANIVAWFDASTVLASDGASMASWAEKIAGVTADQATGGAQPTFKANQLNGKPCIRFPGTAYMPVATPGEMKTAVDGGLYSIIIVARVLSAGGNGNVFGPSAGGDTLHLQANGSLLGRFANASTYLGAPYTTLNSFVTFGYISDNTYSGIASQAVLEQTVVNGCLVAPLLRSAAVTTGSNTFSIGAVSTGSLKANVDIFDIIVWNKALSPIETLQAEIYLRAKYGQALPWAAGSKFYIFDGDSITGNVGAGGVSGGYPYKVAQSLGLTYGQWINHGVGGITMGNMNAKAPTRIDGIPALIDKDCVLAAFEWYNQRAAHPGPFNNSVAYLAARKAASSRFKMVFGTSTDTSVTTDSDRAAYNAAFDAAHTSNIDTYVPIHTNTSIGTEDANANNPSNWSDGVHLSGAGYTILASLMTAGINALP